MVSIILLHRFALELQLQLLEIGEYWLRRIRLHGPELFRWLQSILLSARDTYAPMVLAPAFSFPFPLTDLPCMCMVFPLVFFFALPMLDANEVKWMIIESLGVNAQERFDYRWKYEGCMALALSRRPLCRLTDV